VVLAGRYLRRQALEVLEGQPVPPVLVVQLHP
jgi:hypothetical protein